MGVFQIIFVAINLAVPYWLWSRSSPDKDKAKVDWTVLDKNLARLIESDEGFPDCSTLQVVDAIHALCEKSFKRFEEGTPTAVERGAKQVTFSCHVTKGTIRIGWRLENNPEAELQCREPGGDVISLAPEFSFTTAGRMRSIEFSNAKNFRESIPYRNCRAKAAKVKDLTVAPADISGFLSQIGSIAGDPPDYISANLMCLTFDSSPLWKPWRQKYQN